MKIRHKYGAKPCYEDGFHFPSKLERDYFRYLKTLQESGKVLFFLRQVPFHLPGGKYVCDFFVFYPDGTAEVVDCKGRDTEMSSLKRKQVEALYPIDIKIVRKVKNILTKENEDGQNG